MMISYQNVNFSRNVERGIGKRKVRWDHDLLIRDGYDRGRVGDLRRNEKLHRENFLGISYARNKFVLDDSGARSTKSICLDVSALKREIQGFCNISRDEV